MSLTFAANSSFRVGSLEDEHRAVRWAVMNVLALNTPVSVSLYLGGYITNDSNGYMRFIMFLKSC